MGTGANLPAEANVSEEFESYWADEKRPALRERRSVADRVIEKIKNFVETFIDGID